MVEIVKVAIPTSNAAPLVDPKTGIVTDQWYNFFQGLYQRTGGPSGSASILLDTLGDVQGGMLARFADQWHEFIATLPNSIPLLTPDADVDLKTFQQLLDVISSTPGKGIQRGALTWVPDPSIELAVAAAGTTQGTATVLDSQWATVTNVPANSGVKLFAIGAGNTSAVWNDGANALRVYPQVGGFIDAGGANAFYSLPVGKSQQFRQVTNLVWRTFQPG